MIVICYIGKNNSFFLTLNATDGEPPDQCHYLTYCNMMECLEVHILPTLKPVHTLETPRRTLKFASYDVPRMHLHLA